MGRNKDETVKLTNFPDLQSHENNSKDFHRPPVPKPPTTKDKVYGIDQAIALMKRLPEADMRVLATVIKETLESVDIKVSAIIEDAETKEMRLEEQIKKLDTEIEDLEVMISQRKESIHEFLRNLEETRQVKNNLALATGSQSTEIAIHANLRSKAASEYTAIRDHKTFDKNEGSLPKSLEPADKTVLLDALFADPNGDAKGG